MYWRIAQTGAIARIDTRQVSVGGQPRREYAMPALVVNDVDDEILEILQERAIRNQRTVEEEHLAYLEKYLIQLKGKSFVEMLGSMPDVGRDEDFERSQ